MCQLKDIQILYAFHVDSLPKNEHEHEHGSYHVPWNSRNVEMTSVMFFRTALLVSSPETRSFVCLALVNLPGRQNCKTTHSRWAINLEITPVESKNPAQPLPLGHAYQGRVCQIHREIMVFAHQLSHTGAIISPERQYLDSTALNHLSESILGVP
jgi:hypothetical protein